MTEEKSAKKVYRNIIFDLGDVLISYRWQDMLRDMQVPEKDIPRLGQEMFDDPAHTWHQFDLGATEEEVIGVFRREYPEDAEDIAWFIRHGEYMPVPRRIVWEEVHRLREAGYRLYLLSNYPETLFRKHTMYCDFMKDLDGMVVSCTIHAGKPEPVIYRTLLEKYDLDPGESLFLDDREENVEGARAVGIDAEQVRSEKWLEERLATLLADRQGR